MKTKALEIRHLCKTFGSKIALNGVSLSLEQGEIFALLGPNGAGKSTLISLVAGFSKKTDGEIVVFGENLETDPQSAKMQMGIMPQEIALDSFFTAREVLENHGALYGMRNQKEHVDFLLHKFGLWDQRNEESFRLSGGMKRRLMVAKALVHKPKILILDEPTAGVDVELRQNLWDFVRELHAEGVTILLTTHYLEEAEALADRIAIINHGKIIATDTTKNLLANFGTREIAIVPREEISIPDFLTKKDDFLVGDFSEKNAAKIFGFLEKNAGKIADIKIREPRLEEVFLKFTQS